MSLAGSVSFTSCSARVSSRFSSSFFFFFFFFFVVVVGGPKSSVRYVYHQKSIINRRRQVATRKMIVARASSSSATMMQKNPDGFEQIDLFSPSKINLFLRIVRRREDGYHDLASLFHVIDLGDEMSFGESSWRRKILSVRRYVDSVGRFEFSDQSAEFVPAENGIKQYFWVELKKTVHRVRLGRRSGNAATALYAANKLCGDVATEEELLEWSGDIGSDIRFFSTGAAYCTGRGRLWKTWNLHYH